MSREEPDGGSRPEASVLRECLPDGHREDELRWAMAGARCLLWSAEVRETAHPLYLHWAQTFFSEEDAQQFLPLPLLPGETYREAWYRCRLPEDRGRCDELAGASIRKGKSYEQEFRVCCADGSIRWVRESIRIRTVEEGSRWQAIGVATDITDVKRLEEELRERAEELAAADRRKDEFLAMLAHELRNPLAPILNAVHILRGGPDPERAGKAWQVVERQTQHLARLVDDLLDVARVMRGGLALRLETVNLGDAVARAVESSRSLTERRDQEVVVSGPPEPVLVDADPTRLEQVITNLLNNASKFTAPGGHINLTINHQPSTINQPSAAVIRVPDTGRGIPAEMLPHIWDLFSQADPGLDRAEGGLGIGLTLVRSLVEQHGGTVEAYSGGPGEGAEFVVRLPASVGEDKPPSAGGT